MNHFKLLLIVLLIGSVAACDTVDPDLPGDGIAQLFVGNQGNFSSADGSISVVNLDTWQVSTPIRDLESIVQSVFLYDGRLHVMSNTGQRVDIFDPTSFQRLGASGGLLSPRYATAFFDRIYVSNLFSDGDTFTGGYVAVLDALTYQRLANIEVGANPEGILEQDGRIFVANQGFGDGSTVSVIDVALTEVVQTIDVDCDGPRFMVPGRDEFFYLTCTGGTQYDENWAVIGQSNGAVRIINASSATVVQSQEAPAQIRTAAFGQDAAYDAVNNRLYVVLEEQSIGVYDGSTLSLVSTIGPIEGDPIGAITFDSETERLYLGRVSGFTTQGSVTVHRTDGTLERTLQVGIAPTSLLIRRR
jgi:DNA-binding beta-propeller fold protein YncE